MTAGNEKSMDLERRREPLRVLPSPDSRLDFVTSLSGGIEFGTGPSRVRVSVRYVPGRDVLDPAGFETYLSALGTADWPSLEAVGAAILDDVNNQAVPRYVQVALATCAETGEAMVHSVLLEDRQPGWDNPSLLSRLKPF